MSSDLNNTLSVLPAALRITKTYHFTRNKPELLPQVSRESGVNIITGTGYYVNCFLPEYAKNLTSIEMADMMTNEILYGIGDTGVRCGVIGEIGCSYPLEDSEKRALQAAALVQTKTGCPLAHCSPAPHHTHTLITRALIGPLHTHTHTHKYPLTDT